MGPSSPSLTSRGQLLSLKNTRLRWSRDRQEYLLPPHRRNVKWLNPDRKASQHKNALRICPELHGHPPHRPQQPRISIVLVQNLSLSLTARRLNHDATRAVVDPPAFPSHSSLRTPNAEKRKLKTASASRSNVSTFCLMLGIWRDGERESTQTMTAERFWSPRRPRTSLLPSKDSSGKSSNIITIRYSSSRRASFTSCTRTMR